MSELKSFAVCNNPLYSTIIHLPPLIHSLPHMCKHSKLMRIEYLSSWNHVLKLRHGHKFFVQIYLANYALCIHVLEQK